MLSEIPKVNSEVIILLKKDMTFARLTGIEVLAVVKDALGTNNNRFNISSGRMIALFWGSSKMAGTSHNNEITAFSESLGRQRNFGEVVSVETCTY
ncbi:hypothetical protein [Paenibacillus antibioticophila]|uniref:hypothetical protein n=1 Tax=Paenibacillus antibioticophila TaxID=1274374 RepID=UPI0005C8DAF0|nr:hypothetical protein [Paenibacillus antibioticophila]